MGDTVPQGLPTPSTTGREKYLIRFFEWENGKFKKGGIHSIDELEGPQNWNLKILFCPRDYEDQFPPGGLEKLCDIFDIPQEFRSERGGNVSYSFGQKSQEGRSVNAIWAHFLVAKPSGDGVSHHTWNKPGIWLRWVRNYKEATGIEGARSSTEVPAWSASRVTFIIFDSPPHFVRRTLDSLRARGAWRVPTREPLWLLAEFLRCWHQTVDEAAWSITKLANEVEQTTFQEAAKLPDPTEEPFTPLPLFKAHVVAKNGIYSLEALDSALKCIDKAVDYHNDVQPRSPDWDDVHKSLLYTTDLFHSTRYRINSVNDRMKNVINLVFNLQTMRDSRIMLKDSKVLRGHSRTMRAISLLTMTFLPFSAVSAVFGTQFFGYYAGVAEDEPQRFQVNPAFWIMFLVAVPLTVLVVAWWYLWEQGCRCRWWSEKRRRKVDAGAVDSWV